MIRFHLSSVVKVVFFFFTAGKLSWHVVSCFGAAPSSLSSSLFPIVRRGATKEGTRPPQRPCRFRRFSLFSSNVPHNTNNNKKSHEEQEADTLIFNAAPPNLDVLLQQERDQHPTGAVVSLADSSLPIEKCAVCVIGGGVSGLTAATHASMGIMDATTATNNSNEEEHDDRVHTILLEGADEVGGRVRSDRTSDGFVLDRGFAVFIEKYPMSQQLLNYPELQLGSFWPGALVKLKGRDKLAAVNDPLRQPTRLLGAVTTPIGTVKDKLKLLPAIINVRTKSIPALFDEEQTSTYTAVKERWRFSDKMINSFFRPFLEGIYLTRLEQQSSLLFSFIFKMFSEGAAMLPAGGIGQVSKQLTKYAINTGVDIRTDSIVTKIEQRQHNNNNKNGNNGTFLIQVANGNKIIEAESVIIATDNKIARQLVSTVLAKEEKHDNHQQQPQQPEQEQEQRSVGCMYYSFKGAPPVTDPVLILNGIGEERGNREHPVNNCCFPSVVAPGYAPEGYHLCSAVILEDTMALFRGNEEALDVAVRKQLSNWFATTEILDDQLWKLRKIYTIPNAQPSQDFTAAGVVPANVNGGRQCDRLDQQQLPPGMYICGDHMATSSLNGALESGVNAGEAASQKIVSSMSAPTTTATTSTSNTVEEKEEEIALV